MPTCAGCDTEIPPSRGPRARKWCSQKCRKATLYGGTPCVDCGAPCNANGSAGRAPSRCSDCGARRSADAHRVWSKENILAEIRRWADEYGDPPAIPDWDPSHAEYTLHDLARAERWRQGNWPSKTTVFDYFGSWNAALEAAGFEPRAPHGGGGNELRRRAAA